MHESPVKVLLVEDQESQYILVRRLLDSIEAKQFEIEWVRTAEDGRRGISRSQHDVCLLDYNLGLEDGITMLRECRDRNFGMPVILLTACGDYRTDVAAMRAGAADFLVKDELSPSSLERSIRYATQRAQTSAVIRLMQELAAALNQAVSAAEALQFAVDLFCRYAGWQVGHAFLVDEVSGELISTSAWSFDEPDRYELFCRATREKCGTLPLGVLETMISDLNPGSVESSAGNPAFLRAGEARLCGLEGYFAFPVLVADEVAAVMEFLGKTPVRPDETLVELTSFAAQQLAHVIKRERAAQALQRSEIRFRSVVQSASDAIILTDSSGRIMSWNKGAELIFGYAEHEILGSPMELLMPLRYRGMHRSGFERHRVSGKSAIIGKTIELEGLRKDGTDFPLELSLASWSTTEGVFFTGIMRDITDRKRVVSV
jgi:PAS domain S-box-containing protein